MISFQMFIEKVKTDIEGRFGDKAAIKVQKILKNNGIKETGLTMVVYGDASGPVFYLEPWYEQYKEGLMSIQEIGDEIYDMFNTFEKPDYPMGSLKDFERLKDRIFYKLVSYERNMELLKDIPYVAYLDLAVVFYVLIDRNEKGQSIALIHQSEMVVWRTDTETLYQLAKENTPRLFPPSIEPMSDIMQRIAKESMGEQYRDQILDGLFSKQLYVLSNENGTNGAAVILYEGVLKDFADIVESDLVIVPSSIHETLIIPYKKGVDIESMRETVIHTNQTEVPRSDILSDSVYRYNREKDMVYLTPESNTQ